MVSRNRWIACAVRLTDLGRFDGHIARFLKAFPRFSAWQLEKVAIAPCLTPEGRGAIEAAGYLPQSLSDQPPDGPSSRNRRPSST